MPKLPKDFSKGLIYKLCCLDPNVKEIYVGSSTNFVERKKGHKDCCNNPNCKQYNYKVYQHIRANGNWDNWNMVLIEFYPCDNNLELGRREDYWKQELQASLNSQSPPMYETKQEYYQAHREQRVEYMKEYYEENREKLKEYMKEHYETNKEKFREQHKEYRVSNKEQIAEKMKQKITCECGRVICRYGKGRHQKSQYHQNYLAENPDK